MYIATFTKHGQITFATKEKVEEFFAKHIDYYTAQEINVYDCHNPANHAEAESDEYIACAIKLAGHSAISWIKEI